jgi:hypothetical protein
VISLAVAVVASLLFLALQLTNLVEGSLIVHHAIPAAVLHRVCVGMDLRFVASKPLFFRSKWDTDEEESGI